ncbi:MAG: thioredoxin family protein [Robiginitomaculum sp.]
MKIRHILFFVLCLLWTGFAGLHAGASESAAVKSRHATAQLVTTHHSAAPGDTIYVGLWLELEKHWHTYWRNAGGPGVPAEMNWDIPSSIIIGDMVWPIPQIVRTGPIVNYAFEDSLLLPMPVQISKDAKIGDVITIKAEAAYLVCYEVCLPESAQLSVPLLIGAPDIDRRWSYKIGKVIKEAPKEDEAYAATGRLENEKFIIDFTGVALSDAQVREAYFFPYEQGLIEADDPQITTLGSKGLRLSMAPGFGLEGGFKKETTGLLAFESKQDEKWRKRGVIVTIAPNQSLDIGTLASAHNSGAKTGGTFGLWAALVGALIGGVILNFMPCVFPVLSLKALGFARIAHDERGTIRRHGLLYALGAILSFLLLAGLLIALKASGAGLGWGFQLQNPIVVGGLALLFFIIALNLFGYFETGGRWQNTGAALARTDGNKGAFFTGVLAVIVATPCTAPFMAGALGFAFSQTAIITLLVFLALGIGFALPFLLLSYSPALLKRLPKPGAWMDVFKQSLAFPMLATAIWLIWVLTQMGGADALVRALMAMLLTGFAIWLWKRKASAIKIFSIVALLLGGYFVASLKIPPSQADHMSSEFEIIWSPEAVKDLQSRGKTVFVDFTADWCVTCKMNEKLILGRKKTKHLFKAMNTTVLIANWTRKDARIAAELAKHGRSGVPLYLVYGPKSSVPQVLPQILSYKILKTALEKTQQNGN